MTIVRARLTGFALPLRRPMVTAHERIEVRRGLLVTLVDADGVEGFGEATPLPTFGTEGLAACRSTLEARLARLVDGEDPSAAAESEAGSRTPCADFALSTALADLDARARGVRLADVFARAAGHATPATDVANQVVVAGEAPADVVRGARDATRSGADAFKLKVATSRGAAGAAGGADLGLDVERVAALRECVGVDKRIRLDANEGWTEAEAEAALRTLARFDLDFVEQPVARDDVEAMVRLDRAGVVPIAADEALQGEGWRMCLEARAASAFVLKPAALGGWRRAADVAVAAQAAGIRTIWSTLIDGTVGRGAAVALAAAFGSPGEVHGLGTADWLARDLAPRRESEGASRIGLASGAGLGFVPAVEPEIADGPSLVFETDRGRG